MCVCLEVRCVCTWRLGVCGSLSWICKSATVRADTLCLLHMWCHWVVVFCVLPCMGGCSGLEQAIHHICVGWDAQCTKCPALLFHWGWPPGGEVANICPGCAAG
jgi:hypothetical protein